MVVEGGLGPVGHSAKHHELFLNKRPAGQHRHALTLQTYDASTAIKQDCVLFKRHNQHQDAMWNFPQQGNLSGRR